MRHAEAVGGKEDIGGGTRRRWWHKSDDGAVKVGGGDSGDDGNSGFKRRRIETVDKRERVARESRTRIRIVRVKGTKQQWN